MNYKYLVVLSAFISAAALAPVAANAQTQQEVTHYKAKKFELEKPVFPPHGEMGKRIYKTDKYVLRPSLEEEIAQGVDEKVNEGAMGVMAAAMQLPFVVITRDSLPPLPSKVEALKPVENPYTNVYLKAYQVSRKNVSMVQLSLMDPFLSQALKKTSPFALGVRAYREYSLAQAQGKDVGPDHFGQAFHAALLEFHAFFLQNKGEDEAALQKAAKKIFLAKMEDDIKDIEKFTLWLVYQLPFDQKLYQ